ncbi:MAG: RNA-binding domain-containing protein [Candidatus Hadarchaeum sp.]|uniref:RNA-binding domain-containing protein n=1 Tax=Candidatus Hadarchaeum sp. TaxID=2883567 RepID=UPI0031813D24
MKFPFSSAVISLHAHATEDEQKVLELLRSFLPSSVGVRRSHLTGHHGNPIIVFEARINQRKELKDLWQTIRMKMDEATFSDLRKAVEERMDDSCFLYLRFDKQCASEGRLVLTELGESIHVKLKVISFPAKRDVAVAKVVDFLAAGERS